MVYAIDEITNETDTLQSSDINQTMTIDNNNELLCASQTTTHIDAPDKVSYDVIGENFEVKLLTSDNKPVTDTKITISIKDTTHELKTDLNGKASIQIRLNDGQYKIKTTFQGNSKYSPCSKETLLYINNTRIVDEDLSSSQIQNIIDNAKVNNIILFKGNRYENIHLIIDKRLMLVGTGNTLLKSNSKDAIIEIIGKNSSLTSIQKFNIQSENNGIEIKNSNYVTITENSITSKGNGIIAENVMYLEISKNNITQNGKSGIILAEANDCNIIYNNILSNSKNGISLSKSNNIYIYFNKINQNKENGIYTDSNIDGKYYDGIPSNLNIVGNEINSNSGSGIYFSEVGENLYMESNTINANYGDGISIIKASNANLTSNIINYNYGNGIFISKIGNNNIQYNLLYANILSGIKFNYDFIHPKSQNIQFNVLYLNKFNELEASETNYDHGANSLKIAENWYGGTMNVCSKITTTNINFSVKQIDTYLFNATFYDTENNIINQLPSRTVTHRVNNGRSKSFVLTEGTGTFERDASDGDVIYVTVDMATYNIIYKSDDPNYLHIEYPPYSPYIRPIEDVGKPYPNLPRPGLLEDVTYSNKTNENTNGTENSNRNTGPNGNGNENNNNYKSNGKNSENGGLLKGNGNSNGGLFVNNGNGNEFKTGTMNPENSQWNSTVIQQSQTNSKHSLDAGRNSNSPNSGGSSASPSSSETVVKKIIIDEEKTLKLSGLSLIILLILLTIGFYYREELNEMKSKI